MIATTRSTASRSRGERSRERILATAVDLAAREGLESLSIGRLASRVGMSKSGLFALFGSKEELQLAAVAFEAESFEQRVNDAARDTAPGIERLRALAATWLDYIEQSRARGGCFFASTSSEFGSKPGAVRDGLAQLTGAWLGALQDQAETALGKNEMAAATDPAQLIFELHAYVQEANWASRILSDEEAFDRARRAIDTRLQAAGTRQ